MRRWLAPLSKMVLGDIKFTDLERKVVVPMIEAKKSPRTIQYALAIFSMIWNLAHELNVVSGENPSKKVNRPREDNQRDRFLNKDEANALLSALKKRSINVHDLTLLSIFSGLRAGECEALTWPDIDFNSGTIFVKDTKITKNRHAYMTEEVREMLERRIQGKSKTGLIFPNGDGGLSKWGISDTFARTVRDLGLNDGITDRRQKLVFHSLRHTFGSWLAQKGTPIYTVSKLMGHSSIKMTMRYAHLAPDTKRAAALGLEGSLDAN